MLSELSQHFHDVFNMDLWVGRIYKDIVKEHQDEFVQVLTKKIVHHVHESGRGVGDAKWHDQELVEPLPRLKRSFIVALAVAIELVAAPESTEISLVCKGGVKDGALGQFISGPFCRSIGDGSVWQSILSHSQHAHTGARENSRHQDCSLQRMAGPLTLDADLCQ